MAKLEKLRLINYCFASFLLIFLASCQTDKSFYWGDYEKIILNYNQDSANISVIEKSMRDLVGSAQRNKKVPPGIYAEYGFILLEMNQFKRAAYYFQQEKKLWPESRKLMNIAIKRAKILHDTRK